MQEEERAVDEHDTFWFDNINAWAMVISLLIGVWIALGKDGFGKLNIVAVILLLGLTLLLCGVVFKERQFSVKSIPAGRLLV